MARVPRIPVKAVVEDPYHQAGPDLPVAKPHTIGWVEGGPVPVVPPLSGLCQCGMAYKGAAHLCLKWHYKMQTEEARKELQEAIAKAGINIGRESVVSVELNAATISYLKTLLLGGDPKKHIVVVSEEALRGLEGFHDDIGTRLAVELEPPPTIPLHPIVSAPMAQAAEHLATRLTITKTEDPTWVRDFTARHKERVSAMPICCPSPDPRIARNGRPYCHSCKKYLDKVPPPQLPRPVPEEKEVPA